MQEFKYIQDAIIHAGNTLKHFGQQVPGGKWQGVTSPNDMWEILFYTLMARMPQSKAEMVAQTKCDIPWAEDHFKERVSGVPLNPGNEYKNWPHYKYDSKWKTGGEDKFTHTYMERYWPKFANMAEGSLEIPAFGLRYQYGDLQDVVNLLASEPYTRQAYLPVWFPEDTGALHGGRVPCTLGYWLVMRKSELNIEYHIRACDCLRHFRNDVYLTMRLAKWVLDKLRDRDSIWESVNLGTLKMNIGSLHVFYKEKNLL